MRRVMRRVQTGTVYRAAGWSIDIWPFCELVEGIAATPETVLETAPRSCCGSFGVKKVRSPTAVAGLSNAVGSPNVAKVNTVIRNNCRIVDGVVAVGRKMSRRRSPKNVRDEHVRRYDIFVAGLEWQLIIECDQCEAYADAIKFIDVLPKSYKYMQLWRNLNILLWLISLSFFYCPWYLVPKGGEIKQIV